MTIFNANVGGNQNLELIWKNTSPTSSFAAKEVNCEAIYDYKFFIVKLRQSTQKRYSKSFLRAIFLKALQKEETEAWLKFSVISVPLCQTS